MELLERSSRPSRSRLEGGRRPDGSDPRFHGEAAAALAGRARSRPTCAGGASSRARARAGRAEPPPPELAPISINLDLTTACNYRCDHCIDWDILNTRHRHDDAELGRASATMAARGLRSRDPDRRRRAHASIRASSDIVRFAKELSLQVAVVSNGGRGDRLLEVADALAPGDWLRLSLDAGSDEPFRAMHRPVSRSLTLDEICAWVPRIKARNPSLRIGYSYIIVWRGASRDGVALPRTSTRSCWRRSGRADSASTSSRSSPSWSGRRAEPR